MVMYWGIPKSATVMAAAKYATGIMTNVSTVGSTVAIAGLSPFFWPRHRLALYYQMRVRSNAWPAFVYVRRQTLLSVPAFTCILLCAASICCLG